MKKVSQQLNIAMRPYKTKKKLLSWAAHRISTYWILNVYRFITACPSLPSVYSSDRRSGRRL